MGPSAPSESFKVERVFDVAQDRGKTVEDHNHHAICDSFARKADRYRSSLRTAFVSCSPA